VGEVVEFCCLGCRCYHWDSQCRVAGAMVWFDLVDFGLIEPRGPYCRSGGNLSGDVSLVAANLVSSWVARPLFVSMSVASSGLGFFLGGEVSVVQYGECPIVGDASWNSWLLAGDFVLGGVDWVVLAVCGI
jgi:hypothetical protein